MSGAGLFAHGWFWAYASVFVGGFLTSLTPCVYPLIPITVSLFGARGDDVPRRRAIALASLYVAGIGVMYAILGIGSALAGRAFGTFMANPWVMAPIAALFAIMAASMFGAFELALPSSLQQRVSKIGGRGFAGAFAMGLVGGIIAAPCTGPVLASILAYVATTKSVMLGGSLLVTYALGMGVLFFAIAAFAVALPKSGAWMDGVKSFFGIVMLVAALYFLRNVIPPLANVGRASRAWLVGSLALAAIGGLLGAVHLSFHDGVLVRARKGLGVAVMVCGLFGVIAGVLAPKHESGAPIIAWVHGEDEGLKVARALHRPALLDFYADWCLPCKELELKTFSRTEVARALERFTLVKVNCTTDDDPAVAAAKKRWGAETLPTLILVDADGKVARKIDHFVQPAELLKLLGDAS
ncbi:MAG: Protein-disulfide reductase [Myxococcales bacterium]|nr:Protein-disulfide reductase [Myxococcales bacterium]